MHVAHSNIKPKYEAKAPVSAQRLRVRAWMRRQYQKQFDDVCKEYEADIKEIQKHIPDFKLDLYTI